MEPLIPKRKKTKKIWVGDVAVGGDAPISVQSMTNTETTDVEATVKQINDLEEAGADIVRVSVPSMEAAEAFKNIKQLIILQYKHYYRISCYQAHESA